MFLPPPRRIRDYPIIVCSSPLSLYSSSLTYPSQGDGPRLQEPLQLGELDITSDEFIMDEVDGK